MEVPALDAHVLPDEGVAEAKVIHFPGQISAHDPGPCRCRCESEHEGPGLTERTMRAADLRVRIPMSRGTDSLNVATAAALAFYERVRLGTGEIGRSDAE